MPPPHIGNPVRRSAWRLLITCVVVIGTGVGIGIGYQFGQSEGDLVRNGPLEIPRRSLSIGRVAAEQKYSWTIGISNNTSEPIAVSDLRASCPCTAIQPRVFTVPPAGTQKVALEIDLFSAVEGRDPDVLGERPFKILLIPSIEGYPPLKGWELGGRIYYPYRCSPETVNFGTVVSGERLPVREFEVHCEVPLQSLEIQSGSSFRTKAVRVNSSFRVTVSLTDAPEPGPLKGSLMLQGRTVHGTVLPQMPIHLRGEVVRGVKPVPPTLLFSLHGANGAEEILLIESRTNRPFLVAGIKCHEDELAVIEAPSTTSASTQHQIRLRCLDDALFTRRAIVFRIKGDGETEYELSVPVVVVDAKKAATQDEKGINNRS